MKNRYSWWKAIVPVVFLAGCSAAVHVQQDAGVNLNNYHTYSWVDTHSDQNDNTARSTAYADISVRNWANAELQKAGWREVNDNPDVIISYDILVERSNEQRSDPVYSRPFTRMYYNPYRRTWGSIYYPSQFLGYDNYTVPVKEGTVTISMTDANTDKQIWQGWTTENMNYNRLSEGQINKTVRNIFKKFNAGSGSTM